MSNKTSNIVVSTKSTNPVDLCVSAVRNAIAPVFPAQKKLDGCNATLAETFDALALTLLPVAPDPDAVCWVNLSTDDRVTHNEALKVAESKILISWNCMLPALIMPLQSGTGKPLFFWNRTIFKRPERLPWP